jgi:Zn ribbon nucleic-acid-binding protein
MTPQIPDGTLEPIETPDGASLGLIETPPASPFGCGVTCPDCGKQMEHVMPEEEQWETAHPPIACLDCGHTDVLTIDPYDASERQRIGDIMARLVQSKRDQHHSDHHEGKHPDIGALRTEWSALDEAGDYGSRWQELKAQIDAVATICHHCRDGSDDFTPGCVHCRLEAHQ